MFALVLALSGVVALAAPPLEETANGKKLYEGHCSACHGQTGTGGRGPNLTLPKLKYGATEESLIGVIQNGVPGTEMLGAWQMTEREVKAVAAYIRGLGRVEKVVLPGEPGKGRTLFFGKGGCGGCHVVRGEGTALGPELTGIGDRRSAAYLRESLLQPGASAPEGYMVVEAVTTNGKRWKGQRINEDSFSIQLQDLAGQFHSLRKSSIRELKKLAGESTMPSYAGKLSASELDDVVAWLASLRGEQ